MEQIIQLAGVEPSAEDKVRASFSFFINRDLRRAALLGWITPFPAALSKELMAATAAS